MRINLTETLCRTGDKIFLIARCSYLYLRNFIRRCDLVVTNVWSLDSLIIQGSSIRIFWEVMGCHKIIVAGKHIVPGNTGGIELNDQPLSESVEIHFYGFNSTHKRTVGFQMLNVSFENLVKPACKIPTTTGMPEISIVAGSEFRSLNPEYAKLRPDLRIPEAVVYLESFSLESYKSAMKK